LIIVFRIQGAIGEEKDQAEEEKQEHSTGKQGKKIVGKERGPSIWLP